MNFMIVGIGNPSRDGKKEPETIQDMRKEIYAASRDSSLVHRCMVMGQLEGLSGEETMVKIAYYSLRKLQDTYEQLMRHVVLAPAMGVDVIRPDAKLDT